MASERHERIAELANEIRRKGGYPARTPYTAADVAIIFRAWQADYQARKAAGKVRPARKNAWRRGQQAQEGGSG